MTHYREVCEFGQTHEQCRCPSRDKAIIPVTCDRPDEHRPLATVQELADGYADAGDLDTANDLTLALNRGTDLLGALVSYLDTGDEPWKLVISRSHNEDREGMPDRYVLGVEWGTEAEDSDMVGAASYGMGATLSEALCRVCEEMGVTTS